MRSWRIFGGRANSDDAPLSEGAETAAAQPPPPSQPQQQPGGHVMDGTGGVTAFLPFSSTSVNASSPGSGNEYVSSINQSINL